MAIEDARFWQHGALDYQGILRALYQNLSKGHIVQGGSTITQELVRNLYIGNPQRTLSRKVKEACLATKFFEKNTRKQILTDYLNEVFYGRHAYGAQAAARTYFSKPASKLTLVQAALLAGLPQAPTVYDPLRNPHAALARRNEVLHAMWKNHYISKSELRSATRRKLQLRPGHLYSELHQPNFFGWATQQLGSRLGHRQVELGGLTGQDDAQHAPAGARAPRGQLGPAHPDRPCRGDRVHRPEDRCRESDGRLPAERAEDAVQPRDPGPPVDGQLLQADHARHGAERGRLALLPFYGPPELNIITDRSARRTTGPGTSTTSPTRRQAR